ncbi:MAG: chemotaxis protein CheW [Acidobacteriota bacterium]
MIDPVTTPAGSHLMVLVDGRTYGISMSLVREVATARTPTVVPGLPDYIRGVVPFDERPTPVIDPARFMNGPMLVLSPRSCLVYLITGERDSVVAVLIDDIVAVVDVPLESERQGQDYKTSPLLAASYLMHAGERVAVMQPQALLSGHRGLKAPVFSTKEGSL